MDHAIVVKCGSKVLILAPDSKEAGDRWLQALENKKPMEGTEHVEGWIFAKTSKHDAWHKLYFIIYDGRCWYLQMTVKGDIKIGSGTSAHDAKVFAPTTETYNDFTSPLCRSRYAYHFTLSDGSRLFEFSADTQEQMVAWLGAIERVSRLNLNRTPSLSPMKDVAIPAPVATGPEGVVSFVFTDIQR